MLTFLITSIFIIIWLTMWALQYYYARRAALAVYESMGKGAWDIGDVVIFGVVSLFVAPIFFIIVALDYRSKKDTIRRFYEKDKPLKITRGTVRELYDKLQNDYYNLVRNHEAMEENLEKAEGEIASLKKKNEQLKELTKSIGRFDLMDFEEERT